MKKMLMLLIAGVAVCFVATAENFLDFQGLVKIGYCEPKYKRNDVLKYDGAGTFQFGPQLGFFHAMDSGFTFGARTSFLYSVISQEYSVKGGKRSDNGSAELDGWEWEVAPAVGWTFRSNRKIIQLIWYPAIWSLAEYSDFDSEVKLPSGKYVLFNSVSEPTESACVRWKTGGTASIQLGEEQWKSGFVFGMNIIIADSYLTHSMHSDLGVEFTLGFKLSRVF